MYVCVHMGGLPGGEGRAIVVTLNTPSRYPCFSLQLQLYGSTFSQQVANADYSNLQNQPRALGETNSGQTFNNEVAVVQQSPHSALPSECLTNSWGLLYPWQRITLMEKQV